MQQDLLANPAAVEPRYDELALAPGVPRAHWRRFSEVLQQTRAEALAERMALVQRAIRDSGVTYNVYADPKGLDRPWELDALPMMLPDAEWQQLAAGLRQRAALLNAILVDLYGEGRLLHEGLLPPALVLGHAGFLRPAVGSRPPGGIFLHSYAADLARSPDGRWWVLADRTQAPSGSAYALENRLLVARLFPDLFGELGVARLNGYFNALRESLLQFAPSGRERPLVVVMTPGPYNETYFEHSFLARYLGFPLVEGGDLVVREGCVWLKTLEGLQQVHAILRRQDDSYCDPLELRADSALGVPGLLECARRGTVLVANALGSGVLESGALLGYLPRLCEHLLGEPLRLPSVATWWCGEEAAREDALSRAPQLVFKAADPALRLDPVFGAELDAPALANLVAEVRSHPSRFIAQELVRASQAPTLTPDKPAVPGARPIGLRMFAIATAAGYVVMPGALTRVAADSDPRVISMQRGGSAKDTWVLRPQAATRVRPLPQPGADAPAGAARGTVVVASRVVENLFWYGRYSERCDSLARLLRTGLQATLEGEGQEPGVARVAAALGITIERKATARGWVAGVVDEANPSALPAALGHLGRLAFSLRERMSLDNWQAVRRLVDEGSPGPMASVSEVLPWLDRVIGVTTALAGFALDGMTRDMGWRFLSIGRRLERLSARCLALQVALQEPGEAPGWLLELADSIVTYRARYSAQPAWGPLAQLLVFDGQNPRAVAHQVRGVAEYLEKAAGVVGEDVGQAWRAHVEVLDAVAGASDLRAELPSVLTRVRQAAWDLSDHLTQQVFTHATRDAQALIAR